MKQSWREIQAQYPNEHVVLINLELQKDSPALVKAGEVADHDPELDTVLDRCDLSAYKKYAVKYTGDLGMAIGQRGMVRIIEHD